jgi:hypothetical protein
MVSFAVVAVMTAMTGCHAEKACAAPAPCVEQVVVVQECAPRKKCNLFHKKACAPAPVACETAVVVASPQASAQH